MLNPRRMARESAPPALYTDSRSALLTSLLYDGDKETRHRTRSSHSLRLAGYDWEALLVRPPWVYTVNIAAPAIAVP